VKAGSYEKESIRRTCNQVFWDGDEKKVRKMPICQEGNQKKRLNWGKE